MRHGVLDVVLHQGAPAGPALLGEGLAVAARAAEIRPQDPPALGGQHLHLTIPAGVVPDLGPAVRQHHQRPRRAARRRRQIGLDGRPVAGLDLQPLPGPQPRRIQLARLTQVDDGAGLLVVEEPGAGLVRPVHIGDEAIARLIHVGEIDVAAVVEEPVQGAMVRDQGRFGELILHPLAIVGRAQIVAGRVRQSGHHVLPRARVQRRPQGRGRQVHLADALDVLILAARDHQHLARRAARTDPFELARVAHGGPPRQPPLGLARRAHQNAAHRPRAVEVLAQHRRPVDRPPGVGARPAPLQPGGRSGVHIDPVQGHHPVRLPGAHQHVFGVVRQQVDDPAHVKGAAHPVALVAEQHHGIARALMHRDDPAHGVFLAGDPDVGAGL